MQKNNFLKKSTLFLSVLILGLSISCKQKAAKPEIKFVDFTQTLDSLSSKRVLSQDIYMLKKQYGRFFNVWFSEIMDYNRYANFPDSMVATYFNYFVQQNKPMFKAMNAHYAIHTEWKNDLNESWQNLQTALPNTPTPVVYGYFSQFSNYNTFVDTTKGQLIMGFSKEMFMNDTFPVYAMLEVPDFFNRYNSPPQIPTMLIWNYIKSKFETEHNIKTMLEQAVFEGKIWSLLQEVSPKSEVYDLLGYTKDEWKIMKLDQGQMWRHFLENKLLFSSDFNSYKRYFVYGAHTFGAGIPADCPPMIGSFMGLQIVEAYRKATDCSYQQLFNEHDASKILRLSGYNPVK